MTDRHGFTCRLDIPSARSSKAQLWEQPPRLKQMAYGAFSPVALNAGGQALQLTAGGSDTRP